MICLSKADEDTYRRTTWNQAPSPLAARNTTCQDLNGISNLREHVEGGQADGGGGAGGLFDSSGTGDTLGGDNQDNVVPLLLADEKTDLRSGGESILPN